MCFSYWLWECSFFENIDKLLMMNPLKPDYDEDLSVMYKKDFSFDEDHLSVMRYVLSTPSDSHSWKHTSIFHTFILINEKSYKLVIDGGSFINIVFKSVVNRFALKTEHIPVHLR